MIFIGLGGNLPSPRTGPPVNTLAAALAMLDSADCRIVRRSRWYETSPIPASNQPWFVNGVAEVESALSPHSLLVRMHAIEDALGRVRSVPNAARIIDLDLLVFGEQVLNEPPGLIVPHPRLNERAFVLLPLREIAPDWIDPRSGRSIEALIRDLPEGPVCRPIDHDRT